MQEQPTRHVVVRWLALAALLLPTSAAVGETATGLERIKELAGRWEGVSWWSHRPDDKLPVTMTYYLTGRGTAVVEDFDSGEGPLMTSVYHSDGPDLRMTHFCGAGNQPRLIADRFEEGANTIRFSFVDITNLSAPDAGHVHGSELHFVEDDRLIVKFLFAFGEVERVETIELTRAGG